MKIGVLIFLMAIAFTSPLHAGEIRGIVTDASDAQPLPGVNVYVEGTRLGATTDALGQYGIPQVDSGVYQLTFQFVGYRTQTRTVAVRDTAICNTALKPDVLSLAEIVVTPGRFAVLKQDPVVPQTLSREEIQSMPQFADDIYRTIGRLPGVSGSDFSSRFTIRGGEHDQVLVTLDGLELHEPFHLKDVEGGGLSIVDTDVIGGIDMITGGFPADYGDKLSAVMEMRSADPQPKPRYAAAIGLATARLFAEGGHERTGWLVSARRGYVDLVLKLMNEDENYRPVYYDAFGKLTHRLNDRHRISANALWAADDLDYRDDEEEDYEFFSNYSSGYAWLVWDATFSSRIHARTLPYVGRFVTHRRGSTYLQSMFEDLNESVDEGRKTSFAGLKSDWTFQPSPRHLLRFGFDVKHQNADDTYTRREQAGFTFAPGFTRLYDTIRVDTGVSTTKLSAYVSDKWRVFGALTADIGFRIDRQFHTGETQLSPRAAVALPLGEHAVFRAAWGQYYQSHGVDERNIQFADPAFREAERATHYVLGLEQQLPHHIQLRVEGYYKDLSHIRDRYEDVANEIELMPELHSDIAHLFPENGSIRGIECYLKRDAGGRFNWWMSYTLSRGRETHSDQRGDFLQLRGRTFPQKNDQRHQFAIDIIFRPAPRWNISTAWEYRSGRPHTAKHIVTSATGNPRLHYLDLYDARYPAYHRLDVKLNRIFAFKSWRLRTSLGVVNLYDRDNVRSYYFRWNRQRRTYDRYAEHWFPRLPSFTLSAEF